MTKKLKDITIDEAISICEKRTECSDKCGCPFEYPVDGSCMLQNIYIIKSTTSRGEYYNEHKNDLITFEYDDSNTNTNGGEGISW